MRTLMEAQPLIRVLIK